MKVTIRLFAVYRDRAGVSVFELELPSSATVEQASEEVLRLYPHMASDPTSLVVAVNEEYVEHSQVLHESDEVAFIPPVSGGVYDRDYR